MDSRQVQRANARAAAKPQLHVQQPSPNSGRTLKRRALNKASLDATIKDITDETNAVARGEVWHYDPKQRRPKKTLTLDLEAGTMRSNLKDITFAERYGSGDPLQDKRPGI